MTTPPAPHALLRPAIAIPFLIISLIWGSTWFVITTQIDAFPPIWSVALRFMLATPAMFALVTIMKKQIGMPARVHALALMIGLFQFCGNYIFVYMAELHLTSGVVALVVGLMLVPNAILGWWFLGQNITARFLLGSAIALAGIGLLLLNEAQLAPLGGNVGLGAVLSVIAMLAACIANIIQAGRLGHSVPLVTLIAWSMLYGVVVDTGLALALEGVPAIPTSLSFWGGTLWLAIMGSVVTFPLYFDLVRKLGAGRAAYSGVCTIVIAMILSTLLEGYHWTGLAMAGGLLAMVGLVVALRARQI